MEYRERLTAPLTYWVIGIAFGATTAMAIGLWLGPWHSVVSGVVTAGIIVGLLCWGGRTQITVDRTGLRVGVHLLEWPYTGRVEALDAADTASRLGPKADPRAFVVQRAWIGEAVQVEVVDAADPHPSWLVSSRRPAHLADAIARARAGTSA